MAGMDVAELGLAVDSGPVDRGSRALDKLSGSAKNAAQAALNHAKAEQAKSAAALAAARASETASRADVKAAQAALGSAKAATAQARALYDAEKAAYASAKANQMAAAAARSANDNSRRMGGSMSGLAAQFQDIGVTAAMGMNPMLIALQQGTQIAGQMEMAVQGGGSAVSVLGQAFKSLFSPLSIVAIGLTALAAAALQMVNWAKLAATVLDTIAAVLPVVADEAAIAGAVMLVAFGPRLIRSLLLLSRTLMVGVVGALRAVAAAALANPFTTLVAGITIAVTALYVFRDEVKKAIGVDVIGIIKDGVNLIIGGFVGAFEAVEAVWSKLPGVLGDIVFSTANAVIAGIEAMINKVIQAMHSLLSNLKSSLPAPLQAAAFGAELAVGSVGEVNLGRVENPYEGAVGNAAVDAFGAFQNAQGADYVSKIGDAISAGASKASAKLKELAGDVRKLGEEEDKAGGKAAQRYSKIVEGAQSTIAANKAERDALFLTEEAALKLRYQTELLNKAREAGLKLTPQQKVQLEGLAAEMAATEVATKRTADAIQTSRGIFQGFFSDVAGNLRNGKGFWESFAQAGLNAINKIADKLIEFGSQRLFDNLFLGAGGAGGGGGGIFGSLLSGIGSIFGFAKGAAFSRGNIIPFASGGVVSGPTPFSMAGGRTGVMGEAGPEAIMPLRRGKDGKLGVATNDNNSGGLSLVRIELAEGLKADILQDAAKQSIQIISAASNGIVSKASAAAPGAVADANYKGGGDYRRG